MNKIFLAISLFMVIILIGATGYMIIEKWTLLDSFYMTIITIATVGFHEVATLSDAGRLFTIVLIFFGIGIGGYAIANLSAFIIEGQIQNIFRGKKMQKEITHLNNHYIVCGYGKTGFEIINAFRNIKNQFVVIESNEQKVQDLIEQGVLVLHGDATEDETLEKCGVHKAKGLISSLSNNADNVYVVLTARGMNPNLRIIARGVDEAGSRKLLRAGADKVVSPYSIAGNRMARLLISPGIVEFLEVMVQSRELELKIEEVILHKNSELINKKLNESNIKTLTDGVTIIGIKKAEGKILVNPSGDTIFEENYILYALGNSAQIEKLRHIAG